MSTARCLSGGSHRWQLLLAYLYVKSACQMPAHARPRLANAVEYGNAASFWVEYPTGLVDLTRSAHLKKPIDEPTSGGAVARQETPEPPALEKATQWQLSVQHDRYLRLNKASSAIVIIDMQNYFLHPDLRDHPTGLECVIPTINAVNALRSIGVKVIWVNWGLTEHELTTIPPSLVRGFMKSGSGGFGSELPGSFGRLLMRNEYNTELYGPLQHLYQEGKAAGNDVWIHKNRMSGLWGPQSSLDLYLQEEGITSLMFAGVNADQCVLGTIVDSYYRGYDCIVLEDCTATTSPQGALENVLYNSVRSYGFVTDSQHVVEAAHSAATH